MRVQNPRDAKPGIAARLFGTLFLLFFLGMGLLFLSFIGREIYLTLITYTWDAARCTVIESRVVSENGRHTEKPHRFTVSYHYEYAGRQFTGTTYSRQKPHFSRYSEAQELSRSYRVGGTYSCYVNAEQPSEAVLSAGSLWLLPFILIPLIFCIVGAGGIYFLWRSGPSKPQSISRNALRPKSGQRVGKWIGLLYTLVGLGMVYPLGVRPLLEMHRSQSWQPTQCTVESSRVVRHDGSGDSGPTYSIEIIYHYSVQGKRYTSDRYQAFQGSSSGSKGKREVVRRYPPGKTFTCYYDPQAPLQALIKPGWNASALLALLPIIFILVGFTLFRAMRKKQDSSAQPNSLQDTPPPHAETRTLRPAQSPRAKCLAVVLIALFWNGIISIFFFEVYEGWSAGSPDWFLTIFLTPFVLIGLALLAAIPYTFLALFNPRPEIRITPATPSLGEVLQIQWFFTGKVERISKLSLTLEGREEATYRRGTDTRTDRHVFFKQSIREVSLNPEVRQGNAQIRIPATSMHSFQAANNKIIWSLKLHGEIDRWPDVQELFEITVTPLNSEQKDSVWTG